MDRERIYKEIMGFRSDDERALIKSYQLAADSCDRGYFKQVDFGVDPKDRDTSRMPKDKEGVRNG